VSLLVVPTCVSPILIFSLLTEEIGGSKNENPDFYYLYSMWRQKTLWTPYSQENWKHFVYTYTAPSHSYPSSILTNVPSLSESLTAPNTSFEFEIITLPNPNPLAATSLSASRKYLSNTFVCFPSRLMHNLLDASDLVQTSFFSRFLQFLCAEVHSLIPMTQIHGLMPLHKGSHIFTINFFEVL